MKIKITDIDGNEKETTFDKFSAAYELEDDSYTEMLVSDLETYGETVHGLIDGQIKIVKID